MVITNNRGDVAVPLLDNRAVRMTGGQNSLAGGGFEQAYNAQVAVYTVTMRVVASGLTQAPNDKEQVESVFDTIRSVMGIRQFSLRALNKVAGEWTRVRLAWNLKRMAALRANCVGSRRNGVGISGKPLNDTTYP